MAIDDNSWTETSSPNISVFPNNKLYYYAKDSISNCKGAFDGSKNLKVTLNFNSTVNTFKSSLGGSLVYLAMIPDNSQMNPKFMATNTALNFNNGALTNILILDSSNDSNWKPPFKKFDNFYIYFMIPIDIKSTYQYFPKGTVNIEAY